MKGRPATLDDQQVMEALIRHNGNNTRAANDLNVSHQAIRLWRQDRQIALLPVFPEELEEAKALVLRRFKPERS